ncbi:MAG TPA: glycosyltransferase family 4 protein [Thermoanaerobaculia bacterium]|nr:glycosyltransferase family 4 protein [Thermoanaerobaculia bacterium]
MKILFTNTTLAHRTGSELYVLEVARALLARGHQPVAWSPVLGDLAAELRAAAVPVLADLAEVAALPGWGGAPDLIHGQHHLETMTALLRFPGTPGIFVCHGSLPWEEAPPRFPRLHRYVAVDAATRERLTAAGVPAERIRMVFNFVDLARFPARSPRSPLPRRPRRALVFSNSAAGATFLPAVHAACGVAGLALDVAGIASGHPAAHPETLLPGYDLVFAKGRSALEAMAVGAAVVLCDAAGCGPLVTAAELDRLRQQNFGLRALTEPVEPAVLLAQIARYDPDDAAQVAERVRAEAGLEPAVDRLIEVYGEALAEPAPDAADAGEERRAAAAYLGLLNPYLKERGRLLIDRDALWRRVHGLTAELEAARTELAAEGERTANLRAELASQRATATWRLREALTARPGLVRLYRRLRGLPAG